VGADLDEEQLALHRRLGLELDDLDDVDELVELLGHLLERERVDVDDDGDARDLLVLRRAHGQGVDVERTPGEEAGDARQHARLVLDEHRQGVASHAAPSSVRAVGDAKAASRIAATWSAVVSSRGTGDIAACSGSVGSRSIDCSVQPSTTACAPRSTSLPMTSRYARRDESSTRPWTSSS